MSENFTYCPIQVFDAIKEEKKDCGDLETNIQGKNKNCCWSNNHGAYIPNRCLGKLTSDQLKQIDTKSYVKKCILFHRVAVAAFQKEATCEDQQSCKEMADKTLETFYSLSDPINPIPDVFNDIENEEDLVNILKQVYNLFVINDEEFIDILRQENIKDIENAIQARKALKDKIRGLGIESFEIFNDVKEGDIKVKLLMHIIKGYNGLNMGSSGKTTEKKQYGGDVVEDQNEEDPVEEARRKLKKLQEERENGKKAALKALAMVLITTGATGNIVWVGVGLGIFATCMLYIGIQEALKDRKAKRELRKAERLAGRGGGTIKKRVGSKKTRKNKLPKRRKTKRRKTKRKKTKNRKMRKTKKKY